MGHILKYSLAQIFGNTTIRVMLLVFLFIAAITFSMIYVGYTSHVEVATKCEFTKLETATKSLALQINGERHTQLYKTFTEKDGISDSRVNPHYYTIAQILRKTKGVLNLDSDIYTLVRNDETNKFEFVVTSARRPYYRHVWAHPHAEHFNQYNEGANIGPYEDENGIWLSSFSPIKINGSTVAIIQADKLFSDFISQARADFLSSLLIYGIVFLIGSVILIKIINNIMSKEERLLSMLSVQADKLSTKNQDIMSSIRVARRIQDAVLPNLVAIRKDIPQFEVMYAPKDIVSGDFYWYEKVGSTVYVAAGDCTGHGIPGGFMSMMASTALYYVLNKSSSNLGVMLSGLDAIICRNLESGRTSAEGMDIALCALDTESGELRFAGAFRPIIVLRNGELTKMNGNRKGIGGGLKSDSFEEHIYQTQPGDVIYIFSDGYADQFGGDTGRKYMSKRFRNFLESIQDHPMSEQRLLLQYEFHLWKENHEQVDDVLVIGFEVPGESVSKRA